MPRNFDCNFSADNSNHGQHTSSDNNQIWEYFQRMLRLNNLLATLQNSINRFSDTGVFLSFEVSFAILITMLIRHAMAYSKCQVIKCHVMKCHIIKWHIMKWMSCNKFIKLMSCQEILNYENVLCHLLILKGPYFIILAPWKSIKRILHLWGFLIEVFMSQFSDYILKHAEIKEYICLKNNSA